MFLYHDDELHSALIEKSDESAPHPEAVNSLHTPRRGWQLPRSSDVFAKLLTAILVVNVAGYTILTLLRIGDIPASNQCGLKTDALFGNIPWHEVVLENDEEFMHTDPENFDDGNTTNIWTDIYPGAWVAVPDPSQVGFGGGAKLSRYGEDALTWDSETEAFGVAVMHQIHCVAMLKHTVLEYRAKGSSESEDEHIDHCVEYLRQAVMCHGDLTLERPEKPTYPHRTTGWGNKHQCRDWNKLISAIRALALERGPTGWKRRRILSSDLAR